MKTNSFFYSIDYLTDRPTLYIFGQDKFYTKGGVFLSLVVIVTSICLGAVFLNDFLLKKTVNIVYYKEMPQSVISFNLSESLFMIKLLNNGNSAGKYAMMTILHEHEFGNLTEVKPVKLQKCQKYENFPSKFQISLSQSMLKDYYCLVPGQDLIISFNQETHEENRIVVTIFPCDSNKTTLCAPQEEIAQNFDESHIKVTYLLESNRIDHYNNSNPFSPFIVEETKEAYYNFTYFDNVFWNLQYYTSDNGMIFQNKINYTGISIDDTSTRVQIPRYGNNHNALTIVFKVRPNYVERYYRSYTKLQSVLADIASVMTILKILGQIIINFIIETLFFTRVTFSVFEDKTIYKRNKFDERQIKFSFNSNSILTTPSVDTPFNKKIDLKSDNKNDKIFLFERNALTKETTNIISPIIKNIKEDNWFTRLTITDYIKFYFPCGRSKYKNAVQISAKLVRHSLSGDEIIKDKINLDKLIKICVSEKKYILNHIKPDYIIEMESNKIEV